LERPDQSLHKREELLAGNGLAFPHKSLQLVLLWHCHTPQDALCRKAGEGLRKKGGLIFNISQHFNFFVHGPILSDDIAQPIRATGTPRALQRCCLVLKGFAVQLSSKFEALAV